MHYLIAASFVTQLQASLAEESLRFQSLLLPNTTNITQQLDLESRERASQLNTRNNRDICTGTAIIQLVQILIL